MKALVTGGAGFIGSHLVRACVEAGDDVRVLDDFSTGSSDHLSGVLDAVELIEGSVTDAAKLRTAVADCDVVYHHAAWASVIQSLENPIRAHEVNVIGTLQVLEAARQSRVRRVIYASSSAVYGDSNRLPLAEEGPLNPLSPYALHKRTGEGYCELYRKLHGLDCIALRYFNVYGPRQNPSSQYAAVVPLFLRAVLKGDAPTVDGDGQQTRDFVNVQDVVAANRAAAQISRDQLESVYNIASGERTSLLQLLEALGHALRRAVPEPVYRAPRAGDVRDSHADIRRAKRGLGWEPTVSLGAGLREMARSAAGAV